MNASNRSFSGLLAGYQEYLAVRQHAASFVESRGRDVERFIEWCADRGVTRVDEVTRPVVERYQRWLFNFRKKNGKPLGVSTQYQRLCSVKMFFKWTTRNNHLLHNPASELEMPRMPMRLPQDVLTPREAELVLSQPDVADALGVRDRAILELFYSTGMRRTELCQLTIHGVSQERGTVMIREGKGKRDRVVPVGERALGWVQKYLDEVRPQIVLEPDPHTLFLSATGEVFHPDYMTRMVRQYVEAAKIGKRGSCHLFRHTMATAMLENGADIRFIQVMLGHAKLETTTVYTRVSIAKLKQVHTMTHPAARSTTTTPEGTGDPVMQHQELMEDLAAESHAETE